MKNVRRIKKNTNTNKRSVLVCHNVRFGHSADPDKLQAWLIDARNWIAEQGAQWLDQHKKSKVQKRMRRKVTY